MHTNHNLYDKQMATTTTTTSMTNDTKKRPKRRVDNASLGPRYIFLFLFCFVLVFYYGFFISGLWTMSTSTATTIMNGHPNNDNKTGSRCSLKSLVQRREKEKGIRSEEMTMGLETHLKPQENSLIFLYNLK